MYHVDMITPQITILLNKILHREGATIIFGTLKGWIQKCFFGKGSYKFATYNFDEW